MAARRTVPVLLVTKLGDAMTATVVECPVCYALVVAKRAAAHRQAAHPAQQATAEDAS